MILKSCTAVVACLSCSLAFGEGCDVTSRPASPQVPVVQTHICYEYKGMAPGAIDWSCSNEDKSATPTEKRKVDSCPTGAIASCSATLTQETLANERSASREPGQNTVQVPDDAQRLTWYYQVQEQAQARIDCEQAGGRFNYPLK